MAGLKEVHVPDIGDFNEVDVVEVLVSVGDTVKPEQSLISVESDKATMEIPSPVAGVVKELKIKVGDKVSEGSLLLLLEESAGAAVAPAPSAAAPKPAAVAAPVAVAASTAPVPITPPAPVPYEPAVESGAFKPHASPSIRKFARELGVDLARVRGGGPKGRITQEDVQSFVKGVMKGRLPRRSPRP